MIDASLTAKYGLMLKYTCLSMQVVEAEMTVSLTFAGEVSVNRKWNATVLDSNWKWNQATVPVDGQVSATLSAVGTAMVMGLGVQAKGSAKAGIQLESTFNPGESGKPCSLAGDINFTGVILTVTAVNTVNGTRYTSPPTTLAEPSTLMRGFNVGSGN